MARTNRLSEADVEVARWCRVYGWSFALIGALWGVSANTVRCSLDSRARNSSRSRIGLPARREYQARYVRQNRACLLYRRKCREAGVVLPFALQTERKS